MTYQVNLWGSDPDLGRDECWTGVDLPTPERAREVFHEPSAYLEQQIRLNTGELWLHVPELGLKRQIRKAPRQEEHDDSWQREQAHQAGMGLGIDAYNDTMGY